MNPLLGTPQQEKHRLFGFLLVSPIPIYGKVALPNKAAMTVFIRPRPIRPRVAPQQHCEGRGARASTGDRRPAGTAHAGDAP